MKAVIFDLDGTLQSLEIDFWALRAELEAHFEAHGVHLAEGALLEAVERAMGDLARAGCSRTELEAILRKASGLMDEAELASYPKVRTLLGVEEMLSLLSKKGYRMAVLSRACRPYVTRSLERIGHPFDAFLSRDDVSRPKPDPEGVNQLLKVLGATADNCVIVGDHPFDIVAGKRAGTKTVGVLTGSGDRIRLGDAGADVVLERADAELVKWLDENM